MWSKFQSDVDPESRPDVDPSNKVQMMKKHPQRHRHEEELDVDGMSDIELMHRAYTRAYYSHVSNIWAQCSRDVDWRHCFKQCRHTTQHPMPKHMCLCMPVCLAIRNSQKHAVQVANK